MQSHTTNYFNTFITASDDCPVNRGEVPVSKNGELTMAMLQFQLIYDHPYHFSSDDVIFQCYATKNKILANDMKSCRDDFYSKGQACFRSSPLTKRYGWGVHFNHEGKMALYEMNSKEYKQFINDKNLKVIKAMRNRKAQ